MVYRENFPTNFPAGPNLPTGRLLNGYGRVLNSLGDFGTDQRQKPLLIGMATITDASNTGGLIQDGTQNPERDAPNADNNKYLINFRFWHAEDQRWKEHDLGTTRLDAGGYHNGTPGSGSIPKYAVGDVVPVLFDQQRNWCVPLHAPPEQIAAITFRAQESITIPKLKSAPYTDTATVTLELRRQEWHHFLPELSLKPSGVDSGVFGEVTVVVALRHYDQLRLTGGTGKHTSTNLSVYEYGFSVVPLARLNGRVPPAPGQESGIGEMTGAYTNFEVLKGLKQTVTCPSRFKDTPTFQYIEKDKSIRVAMADPWDQWMVVISYWAEVLQSWPSGVWLRIAHVNEVNELLPAGKLVDPIEVNGRHYHQAVIDVIDETGEVLSAGNPQRAYVRFVDYPGDDGDVIAEQGRRYGPCQFVGVTEEEESDESEQSADSEESSGSADTERPVFLASVGEQEYLALHVSQGGTQAKGSTEQFELLWGPSDQPAGVFVDARAALASLQRGKKAIVRRENRQWIAAPGEC